MAQAVDTAQYGWLPHIVSERQIALYHYRDKDKNEVDIVIEDEPGGVVGL
jgi:hypothetical protein